MALSLPVARRKRNKRAFFLTDLSSPSLPVDLATALNLRPSLARTVLFSSLGIIVRWSIGVRLLSSAEAVTEDGAVPGGGEDLEGAAAAASSSSSQRQTSNGNANANDNASETTLRPSRLGTAGAREDDQDEREQDRLLVHSNGNGNGNSKGKRASILKKSPQQQQKQNGTQSRDGHVLTMDGDHDDDDEDEATKTNGQVKTYAQAAAVDPEAVSNGKKNKNKKRRVFQSFPNTPIPSVYSSSSLGDRTTDADDHDDDDDDDDDDDESSGSVASDDAEEWGYRRGFGRRPNGFFSGPRATRFKKFLSRAWKRVKRIGRMVGEFMTVPLWAAVLSLAVACIPPVQHTLNKAEPLKACVPSQPSFFSFNPPSCLTH